MVQLAGVRVVVTPDIPQTFAATRIRCGVGSIDDLANVVRGTWNRRGLSFRRKPVFIDWQFARTLWPTRQAGCNAHRLLSLARVPSRHPRQRVITPRSAADAGHNDEATREHHLVRCPQRRSTFLSWVRAQRKLSRVQTEVRAGHCKCRPSRCSVAAVFGTKFQRLQRL